MWQNLLRKVRQILNQAQTTLLRSLPRHRDPSGVKTGLEGDGLPDRYSPVQRVLLSDAVGRALFEEYARHRQGSRGREETGWVLLGLRQVTEMVVLGTLPAGSQADRSATHVRFNSNAQVLGSRIIRQGDPRLTILGVVHTHPGSLRHPSRGDYEGDRIWVRGLRGREGIFGIGTADLDQTAIPHGLHPRPHVQCWGDMQFSWYALGDGDASYRPVPVELVHGPDLTQPLHAFWPTLEKHAESLERLACQQNGVQFQMIGEEGRLGLLVILNLVEPDQTLRLLVRPEETRYLLQRQTELFEILPGSESEGQLDQVVYLLLAELAKQARV